MAHDANTAAYTDNLEIPDTTPEGNDRLLYVFMDQEFETGSWDEMRLYMTGTLSTFSKDLAAFEDYLYTNESETGSIWDEPTGSLWRLWHCLVEIDRLLTDFEGLCTAFQAGLAEAAGNLERKFFALFQFTAGFDRAKSEHPNLLSRPETTFRDFYPAFAACWPLPPEVRRLT